VKKIAMLSYASLIVQLKQKKNQNFCKYNIRIKMRLPTKVQKELV
jgi:hypothetical protein